jgi:hypothetical protein
VEADALKTPTVVVGKGGPSFIDLRLPTPALRVLVTGPGMLVSKLRLVTSLGILDGCTVKALEALRDELEVLAACGHSPPARVEVVVESDRTGSSLTVGVGPTSMYQTELLVRTRTREPLTAVIHRNLVVGGTSDYFVGLVPVAAEGSPEHQHGPIGGGDGGHGGHGGGGSHGGHDGHP